MVPAGWQVQFDGPTYAGPFTLHAGDVASIWAPESCRPLPNDGSPTRPPAIDCYQQPRVTGTDETETYSIELQTGCVATLLGEWVNSEGHGVLWAIPGPLSGTNTITSGEIDVLGQDFAQRVFADRVQWILDHGYAFDGCGSLPTWDADPCPDWSRDPN